MSTKLASVLLLDGVDAICASKLTEAGIKVKVPGKLTKEQLIEELKNHDGVVVRSATKLTQDILISADRLKVIGRAGTGVDNIDIKAATTKGIIVMNTPGGNTLSAAEHTCALICSLSRSIPLASSSIKSEVWDRKSFMGNELFGKTLAIIGLGRIGREVASRMQAFRMKTIGFDPMVSKEDAATYGIEFLSLEQIWPLADYITVHTPLIPQTKYLINAQTFKQCKSSVKIVNVARGGIVSEKDLFEALNNGSCAGAALDVFETEPVTNFDLVKHPKVIATPHLGANTREAQVRVAEEIADQFIDMSNGRPLSGIVNVPSLSLVGSAEAKPWVELASSMTMLAMQVIKEGPIEVKFTIEGEQARKYHIILEAAVLKEVQYKTNKNATLVNAKILTESNKNAKLQTDLQSESKNNSLKIQISVADFMTTLSGTVSNGRMILDSWDDSIWANGVTIQGNLSFFKSSTSELNETISKNQTKLSSLLFSSGPINVLRLTDNTVLPKTYAKIDKTSSD